MLLNLSLSAAKPKYTEFDWFKFTGVRGVQLENKDYEVQIDAGERFGIFIAERGIFYVSHEDAPEVLFKTDAKTARSLMSRATYYKGRVKGKAVNNSRLVKGATVVRDPDAQPPQNPAPDTKPKAVGSAKDILTAIRAQRFPKPRSIVYMRHALLHEEKVYYFDATSSYLESKLKADAWEKQAEKMLIAAMAGTSAEVGAVVQQPTSKTQPERAVLMVKVDA